MFIPFPIDLLWTMAESEGVPVVWYPGLTHPRGRYYISQGQAIIFLNPALERSSMRLRCTLAHELGHHFSGVGGDVGDDERAMRWAYSVVLPWWWLESRLEWDTWRIAEEADVYQEWAEARLKLIWGAMQEIGAGRREAASSF